MKLSDVPSSRLTAPTREYIAEMTWRSRLTGAAGEAVASAVIQEADRLSLTTLMDREDARRLAEQTAQAELNRRARGDQ